MRTFLKSQSSLTIFTTCKPWRGNDAIAQWNALQSWTLLQPRPDIIVYGDEYGTRRITTNLNISHHPGVKRPRIGPPYLDAMFRDAQADATTPLICYVNADIIMPRGLIETAEMADQWAGTDPFLVVGRRLDTPALAGQTVNFSFGWQANLERYANATGEEHGPAGLDWFLFRRKTMLELKPFIIGRGAWDNYLLLTAGRRGFKTIDATDAVLAVHQADSPTTPDAQWQHNKTLWEQEKAAHGEGTTDSCLWKVDAHLNVTTTKQGGNRYADEETRR